MQKREEIIEAIRQLFQSKGEELYFGESVSQYEHAAQTALLALANKQDNDTVIAAFLHDIGHLLPSEVVADHMGKYGRKNHESLAANWLEQAGFSKKTTDLIVHHVDAKRYLVFKTEGYYDQLSEASKKTLTFQGGMMSPKEAAIFEQHPYFREILQMRAWDEEAKVEGMDLPSMDFFLRIVRQG